MADRSLEERVAVHGEQIDNAARELERARVRLHKLESALRGVEMLTRRVEELQQNMPTLARQAAREAVTEFQRRRHADTFSNWRTYAALLSAGAALGALIVAVILHA